MTNSEVGYVPFSVAGCHIKRWKYAHCSKGYILLVFKPFFFRICSCSLREGKLILIIWSDLTLPEMSESCIFYFSGGAVVPSHETRRQSPKESRWQWDDREVLAECSSPSAKFYHFTGQFHTEVLIFWLWLLNGVFLWIISCSVHVQKLEN